MSEIAMGIYIKHIELENKHLRQLSETRKIENEQLKKECNRYKNCLEFLTVTHANSRVQMECIERALNPKPDDSNND